MKNHNILICDISYKNLIGPKPLQMILNKIDILEIMMDLNI